MAEFLLHVAHGAHVQQAAQGGAGGHRNPRHDIGQAPGFLVDQGVEADVVVVADLAEADGVGHRLLAAHQFPGLDRVVVGAEAADMEVVAEETGLELEILARGTQRHRDDFLHCWSLLLFYVAPAAYSLAAAGAALRRRTAGLRLAAGFAGRAWRMMSSQISWVM